MSPIVTGFRSFAGRTVHPKAASEPLRHAGVTIAMDIYLHVLPGTQKGAAEKFSMLLSDIPWGFSD